MQFPAIFAAALGLLAVAGGRAPDAAAPRGPCDPLAVRPNRRIDLRALERFGASGCALDGVDAEGFTLLSWALHNNEEKAMLWLIEHGAEHKSIRVGDETVLHRIAQGDNADSLRIVDALVRHGADVNAIAKGVGTPLQVAAGDLQCTQTKRCSCSSDEADPADCWYGNPKMVRALLKHGADPNLTDGRNPLPLFMAISHRRLDDVRALLAAHAVPGGLDGNEETLWQVMSQPDLRIVRALLAAGADVNEPDGYGDTPLHILARPESDHARAPLVAAAKLLLARGADPRAANKRGQTPLHEAASAGFANMARLLIDARVPVDASDKEGQTPLHLAAWHGRVDVTALLLRHGADASRKDSFRLTPLHWLARGRSGDESEQDFERTLRLLVARGAKIDDRDGDGRPPLWHAHDVGVRNVLLAHGAGKNDVGPLGESLLHLAAFRDDGDLIWRRTGGAGANPNVTDAAGRTPLHWASFLGRARAADRLILSGAIKLDIADGKGLTALDWAIASCQTAIAAQLVRRGAHATTADWKRRLDACPTRREPPPVDERLHRAVSLGDTRLVKELLDAGLPVNGQDLSGRTSLHVAAAHGPRPREIKLLLERGATVNAVDREGQTPLHFAAATSNVEEARQLLQAGASANAADDLGRRPLHLAAARDSRSFDLYRLLIEAGAKLDARDLAGRTPLHAVCDTDEEWAARAAELFVCRGAEAGARDAFGWTAAEVARLHGWRETKMPRCPAGDAVPGAGHPSLNR